MRLVIYDVLVAVFLGYFFYDWCAQGAPRRGLWNAAWWTSSGKFWDWALWKLPGLMRAVAGIVGVGSILIGVVIEKFPPLVAITVSVGGLIGAMRYHAWDQKCRETEGP